MSYIEEATHKFHRLKSWWENHQGPRFRTLTSVTELGDVMSELGVSGLTKSLAGDGSTSQIDWRVDISRPQSSIMGEKKIAPRTLIFGQQEDGQLTFECEILGENLQVDDDGLVLTREDWSDDPGKRYSPVKALWLFLMAFEDRHTPQDHGDVFSGFQFFSLGNKGDILALRLGKVQFEFQLDVKTGEPLHGTLVVRKPL